MELSLGAPISTASTLVTLLGSSIGPLPWHSTGSSQGIVIDVSGIRAYSLQSDWVFVFKLENVSGQSKNIKKSKKHRN